MNYVKNTIGWADFTSNAIKGLCPMTCSYCYAKAAYHRFGWDPTIRFDKKETYAPAKHKKPARIFVGSTIEMYHPLIPIDWVYKIIYSSLNAPRHIFITLTKRPEDLSLFTFPDSWWIGVTINNFIDWIRLHLLKQLKSNLKFISFEPLLDDLGDSNIQLEGIDWIILGGQSGPQKFFPPKAWIQRLEDKADKLGIPVFEKSNLYRWDTSLRQEFPKGA